MQISMRLQEDGLPPDATEEEKHRFLWQQLLGSEAKLHSVTQELQTLRTQQANEMKEVRNVGPLKILKKTQYPESITHIFLFTCQVESYVAHIRGLLEERESLTADYERDNEQLRHELHQIRQQQGITTDTAGGILSFDRPQL